MEVPKKFEILHKKSEEGVPPNAYLTRKYRRHLPFCSKSTSFVRSIRRVMNRWMVVWIFGHWIRKGIMITLPTFSRGWYHVNTLRRLPGRNYPWGGGLRSAVDDNTKPTTTATTYRTTTTSKLSNHDNDNQNDDNGPISSNTTTTTTTLTIKTSRPNTAAANKIISSSSSSASSSSSNMTLLLRTPEDMYELGALLSQIATERGDVLWLEGDLGSGKTCFCRGFVQTYLGDTTQRVTSPTYLLCQTYNNDPQAMSTLDIEMNQSNLPLIR
jgi:Threonylcarbamoyl adenosine biosynthesis protein TsaE